MTQSGVSVSEPSIVGVTAVTVIETASRDLEDLEVPPPPQQASAFVWPPRAPGRPGSLRQLLAADHGATAWREIDA